MANEKTSQALTTTDGKYGLKRAGDDAWAGKSVTQMYSLTPDDALCGIFEGKGPDVDMTDPATGEVKPVSSWFIRVSPALRFQILGASQLDAKLGAYPVGAEVTIQKLAESRRSRAGRVVSQYLVSDPPVA